MRQRTAKALLLVSTLLFITRSVQIIVVPIFLRFSLTKGLMSDDIHHYQIGLALLLVAVIFYRFVKQYSGIIMAVCVAWLVEEHLIILEQLGYQIPHYYLSTVDTLLIYSLSAIGIALGWALGARVGRIK